jgi:hypothetical protein
MSLFEKASVAREKQLVLMGVGELYKPLKRVIEELIKNQKREIKSLETSLAECMPATKTGEVYCESCGVKSMKREESINLGDKKIIIYKCQLCGDEFADRISQYM